MATTAKYNSAFEKKKFQVRKNNRCPLCGRPRAFMRRFNMAFASQAGRMEEQQNEID